MLDAIFSIKLTNFLARIRTPLGKAAASDKVDLLALESRKIPARSPLLSFRLKAELQKVPTYF